MKNIAAIALFLAATFIAAGPASAQDHLVKATVPFSFNVGDKAMPAGTYMIRSNASSPVLLTMRNWDKKVALVSLAASTQSDTKDDTLVFHRYGDQYFLSDIRSEGASIHVHYAPTKAEKRAKSQVEEAGLPISDPVLIALNR